MRKTSLSLAEELRELTSALFMSSCRNVLGIHLFLICIKKMVCKLKIEPYIYTSIFEVIVKDGFAMAHSYEHCTGKYR